MGVGARKKPRRDKPKKRFRRGHIVGYLGKAYSIVFYHWHADDWAWSCDLLSLNDDGYQRMIAEEELVPGRQTVSMRLAA